MQFFNFKILGSKEDIIHRFTNLRASEYHDIFVFFDRFYDDRVGLHTYINGNVIKGYYESGKRYRERLESDKVWFYGNIVEKNGVCKFRWCIFCSSILVEILFILLGIIKYYYYYSEPIVFLGIIWFVLYKYITFKEEDITYEYLQEVMERLRK